MTRWRDDHSAYMRDYERKRRKKLTPEQIKTRRETAKFWKKRNPNKVADYHREFKRRQRQLIDEFKSGLQCEHCGEGDPICLDFHHRDPAEKDFHVADMNRWGIDRIITELEKCDVLCANCHRKEHRRLRIEEGPL